jgi:hypothetical protein
MRLVYQMGRWRTNVRDPSAGWALPSQPSMTYPFPNDGHASPASCTGGLSGSSRGDGVDVKQTSYEACKEWR